VTTDVLCVWIANPGSASSLDLRWIWQPTSLGKYFDFSVELHADRQCLAGKRLQMFLSQACAALAGRLWDASARNWSRAQKRASRNMLEVVSHKLGRGISAPCLVLCQNVSAFLLELLVTKNDFVLSLKFRAESSITFSCRRWPRSRPFPLAPLSESARRTEISSARSCAPRITPRSCDTTSRKSRSGWDGRSWPKLGICQRRRSIVVKRQRVLLTSTPIPRAFSA